MDVVAIRWHLPVAFASLALLAGCKDEKATTPPPVLNEITSTCQATAIGNRFLVHWKDGSISVEHAADRDAFMKEIAEPNADDIAWAENDQIVRLPRTKTTSLESMSNVPVDWGQKIIEAPEAWKQNIKGEGVIVAVIDSGVDIGHPQLVHQLAVNAKEIVNGIDDDKNGLTDDINGWDFYANTGTVTDGTGHGTHVAGIIVAEHEAGEVLGIAPKAKLLPLDFMNDAGAGTIAGAVAALEYAVSRGARVINASWGGGECSQTLRESMQSLENKGVLFVVAAGNSGTNLDREPEYPAAFNTSGQLTVAAASTRDILAGFSNYSYSLVHLAAPGVDIFSTIPGNQTAVMRGTSMATPFVSAAAALLFSFRPNATVEDVRLALTRGVDRDPSSNGGIYPVSSGGRLNVRKALEELAHLVSAPPPPSP